MATQKPENSALSTWWRDECLPVALGGKVIPTLLEKRRGGLGLNQGPCDDIAAGQKIEEDCIKPW
jgi:hypothetical protein